MERYTYVVTVRVYVKVIILKNLNKIKLKKQFFMIVLFTILFLPIVEPINLSTIQKNQYSQVRIGESTEFIVLFWNTENYTFPIELSVKQAPENFSIIIRPEKFMIEPSLVNSLPAEADKEYVDTPKGLMKAFPVRIIVKPSSSATSGEYDIYVKVEAISTEAGIITPVLEKTFKFTVKVISPLTLSERVSKITGDVINTIKDVPNKITGMVTAESTTSWTLLIIFIIVLALLIWFIWLGDKNV